MRDPLEDRKSTRWSPLLIVGRKIVFGAVAGICLEMTIGFGNWWNRHG